MKIIIILIASLLLISCSEYKDQVLVCKGTVSWYLKQHHDQMILIDEKSDQLIGLVIKNDLITLTGNSFVGINDVNFCKDMSDKNTFYFEIPGCSEQEKKNEITKHYGRYNFITKEIDLYEQFFSNITKRIYHCEDSK
jgi:hypothetical protein